MQTVPRTGDIEQEGTASIINLRQQPATTVVKKERKRKENKKYKRKWQKKRIQNKRKEKERNKDPYDCSPDLYMVIANSITHRPKTRLEALPLAFPILTGVTLASREHNISSQGALVQVR